MAETQNGTVQFPSSRGELQGFELQRSLLGTDTLHRLMFSTLMLRWWLTSGHEMTLHGWIELNTGIEGNGGDVPVHVQTNIYSAIAEGTVSLSRALSSRPTQMKPLASGWAFVRYSAQQAHVSTDPSYKPAGLWPEVSPQILAEQGGASASGRSHPSPSATLRLREVPHEVRPVKLLDGKRPDEGPGVAASCCEAAWVTLHGNLVVLAADASDSPPYAFVPLRHVTLRESTLESKTLLLGGRNTDMKWSIAVEDNSEDASWLEVVLLLGDARFQSLEAPQLELRFETSVVFEAWSSALSDVCGRNRSRSVDEASPLYDGDGLKSPKVNPRQPPMLAGAARDDPLDFPPAEDHTVSTTSV